MANHGGMSFIAEQVCLMSCLFSFFSYFKENADFTKFTCLSLSSIFLQCLWNMHSFQFHSYFCNSLILSMILTCVHL